MKTKVVHILIRRSLASEVSDVVEAHEVPVLRLCHGAANITVVEGTDCSGFNLQPREVKARDLLIQMKRKYNSFVSHFAGQNPVDLAYPDGSRDVELYYEDPSVFDNAGEGEGPMVDDEFNPVIDTSEKDELPTPPEAEKDELPTPPEMAKVTIDRNQVKKDLSDLGIPFPGNASNIQLDNLLTQARETLAQGEE